MRILKVIMKYLPDDRDGEQWHMFIVDPQTGRRGFLEKFPDCFNVQKYLNLDHQNPEHHTCERTIIFK